MPLHLQCAPAFNYARSKHTTKIIQDDSIPHTNLPSSPNPAHMKAFFSSAEAKLDLDLRYVPESTLDTVAEPRLELKLLDLTHKGHLGPSIECAFELEEGQIVTWVLRTPPDHNYPDAVKPSDEKAEELGVSFESMLLLLPVNLDLYVSC